MVDWPADVTLKRFAPREVASITGVSEDRQRQIAKRHFDARVVVTPNSNAHRRWDWRGMQRLAVFNDVMDDTANAELALALADGCEEQRGFDLDQREHPDGDVLIVSYFRHDILGVSLSQIAGLNWLFNQTKESLRPKRLYLYNLSGMQRRLFTVMNPRG